MHVLPLPLRDSVLNAKSQFEPKPFFKRCFLSDLALFPEWYRDLATWSFRDFDVRDIFVLHVFLFGV
jgi:hypothetical protein